MNSSKKEDTLIEFSLTRQETNVVLEALGNMPFVQVYKIIEKLHLQANKNKDQPSEKNNS